MLIFLYGSDSYRRQKKLNNIIAEYRKKHSNLSCEYFDLDPSINSGQEGFLRLKEFSAQMLIFDSKKLAVLRNAFTIELKDLRDFLKKYLNAEELTILISEDTLPEELKSLAKKAFLSEKFKELEADEWRFFIAREIQQRKIALTLQAIDFLAEAFKKDTWGLINELDKLVLISKKSPIDVNDLKKVGDYSYESPDIFGYINVISKNWPVSQKIVSLEKLFIIDEEPVKIFNIMASLKYLPKELIQKLANYDVMLKSGKLDYEEILIDLALSGPTSGGEPRSNF